jgi:hypothetical protein
MFHPVGPQPPSVYWRRRLLLLGSVALLLILLLLTVKIASSDGGEPAAGGGTTPPVTTPTASNTHRTTTASRTPSSQHSSRSPKTSSTVSPQCVAKDLAVSAVVAKTTYHVGEQPVLELEVKNTGDAPCVQDLADKQIELRVYNGESRVWGSHDCQIQPGTNDRTLAVGTPVRVAITWSGLTSQPGCAGTRQRVGAGTYTLYALLSGKTGKATQFTIS